MVNQLHREIAVLPCLAPGHSIEDERLESTAPAFYLQHVRPNDMLANVLSFLNVSKPRFLELVKDRRGIDLTSDEPHGRDIGPWAYRPAYAPDWRALAVEHDPNRPALLDDNELEEIFDNASYGGQLAMAGLVDADFRLPRNISAVQLSGRFQIGIIDYLWGSGHTVAFEGALTIDLNQGQIGSPPGTPFDEVCGFVYEWFRFSSIARAELPDGQRFEASRAPKLARAA